MINKVLIDRKGRYMIKTVIFDIDNTLYNFDASHKEGMEAVYAYVNEQFGWEKESFSATYSDMMKELFDELGDIGAAHNRLLRFERILENRGLPLSPHAMKLYSLYWDTLIRVSEISPGAEETIRALKEKGLRIGIGSDMTAWVQYRKLEKLGLLPYFDFVVTSEESDADKPDARFYALCLRKAHCEPDECIYIGDNYWKDYRGSMDAGIHPLWFVPPHLEEKAAKIGDESARRIGKLSEILDEVERLS